MIGRDFDDFCAENDFRFYANITAASHGEHPVFANRQAEWSSGYVYIWVEKDHVGETIVYVGEAGSTMDARCDGHTGGFRPRSGSITGQGHSDRIMKGIDNGKLYSVFATSSLSPHEDENRWLGLLRPLWNQRGV
jgi:hypothetical protein